MWYLLALSLALLSVCRPLSLLLLAVCTLWGYCIGVITWPMLGVMLGVSLVVSIRYLGSQLTWLRLSSEVVLVAVCLLLITHAIGGVTALSVVDHLKLGPHSAPFSLYYHFDKALIPFILLAILPDIFCQAKPSRPKGDWCLLVVTVPALLILATLLGGLAFELHFPDWLGSFLLANIFFVCLAEEALFRGYLQRRLAHYLPDWLALICAAVLFGGLHYAGGPMLVVFASLAGVIYGLAWQWSGKLWVAVGFHLLLNLTHLLFFTYPFAVK